MLPQLFTVVLAIGLASSNVIVKRQFPQVEAIVSNLGHQVHQITPELVTLIAQDKETNDNVSDLINQLNAALDDASSQLQNPSTAPAGPSELQTADDVATIEAAVVSDIAQALGGLPAQAAQVPSLSSLLASVDTSLSGEISSFTAAIQSSSTVLHNFTVENSRIFGKLGLGKTNVALGQPAGGATP